MIVAICLACNNYSISEKQADSFLKYFPISPDDNLGVGVTRNLNGGYVILSNISFSGGAGSNQDIPVIFCDEFGRQGSNSPVWVGSTGEDKGNCIIPVSDGYIISGSSNISGEKEGLLMKIGTGGQLAWLKNYSNYPEMELKQVIQSLDGTYLATGSVVDSTGKQKAIVIEATSNGDLLWITDPQGYSGFDVQGESIIEYQSRILVVAYQSISSGGDQIVILNAKRDGRGIVPYWIPQVAGEKDLVGIKIIRDLAGRLYVLGNEVNPIDGFSRIFLAKIELSGGGNEIVSVVDSAFIDNPWSVHGNDIKPVPGGQLAVCGRKSVQNDLNIYFALFNENLELTLSREFGSKGDQSAYGLYITGNGGYALTGSADLGGAGTTMLLKLDSDGELK